MPKIRQRLFQAWFRFSRPMTLGVRAAVRRSDGAVLLVRHTYTPGLHLPGGGLETGETALMALRKELREEGGIELRAPPDVIAIYANQRSFPGDHVLLYQIEPGDWAPCTPDSRGEISERLWVDPLAPPPDTTDATARRLAELFSAQPRDELW